MYTRCPACRTVFHVTAAELRAAEGTVICGACGATFDAIASLSETRPPDPPDTTTPSASTAVESEPEADELARDEDEFLEEVESLIGAEGAIDESYDHEAFTSHEAGQTPAEPSWALLDEASLPKPGPAEVPSPLPQQEPSQSTGTPGGDSADEDLPELDALLVLDEEFDDFDDAIPDPDSVFRLDDDEQPDRSPREPRLEGDDGSLAEPPRLSGQQRPDQQQDEPAPAPASRTGAAAPAAGTAQASDAELPVESGDDNDALPEFAHAPGRRRLWLRVLAPVLVALVLLGTWVHAQRGQLLRHPAGEAVLAPIYALLRIEVAPDWQPDEFRVLRSEAVAAADRPDDLQVAVQFRNAADFAQPYPVIRISLQDRFGRPLGTHDFSPAQYLRNQTGGGRLPAGGQVQATVTVPDPNARADGFRVSLCVDVAGRGLVCAPEPFRQP